MQNNIAGWIDKMSLRRAWAILAIAAVLAGGVQLAILHRMGIRPNDASAASASSVMGLMHSRGLTVSTDEIAASFADDPRTDLLTLYRPVR